MQVKIDEKTKTITIVMPLQEPKPSASGKNVVIATTSGNMRTEATYKGHPITVGLNAFFKP